MAEIIAFLKKSKVDLSRAISVITETPVCSLAAAGAAHAIILENYSPAFPIVLVEKDFSYAESEFARLQVDTPLLGKTRKVFKKAVEQGFGEDNITGVAQLYQSI